MLTLGESDSHLDQSLLIDMEIDRHNGETFYLHILLEFPEFPLDEKNFPVPVRIIILLGEVGVLVWRDMKVLHIQLTVDESTIGVGHVQILVPVGLYLTSLQDNTGIVLLGQEVVVVGLAVIYQYVRILVHLIIRIFNLVCAISLEYLDVLDREEVSPVLDDTRYLTCVIFGNPVSLKDHSRCVNFE